MKNSAGSGGCYPRRPKAKVDNTLQDLQNSSYPTKAALLFIQNIFKFLREKMNFICKKICTLQQYRFKIIFTLNFGEINLSDRNLTDIKVKKNQTAVFDNQ